MIRMLARRMAEETYPGAIARGGIPVEAVAVMTLHADGHVLSTWMDQPVRGRNPAGPAFPLANLKAEAIQSIEVLKGNRVGIENLGVVVVTLKPKTSVGRIGSAPGRREIPLDPATLQQPRLYEPSGKRVAVGRDGFRIIQRGGDTARVILREVPPR
jgi:hypothetical protein